VSYWDQYDTTVPKPPLPPDMTNPAEVPITTPPPAPPEPPDKYMQDAIARRDALLRKGVPLAEGYADRAARGFTLGLEDEALAGMSVPLEMYRHGTLNPAEAYRYGKAAQTLRNQKIDENTAGFGGAAAELLGGLSSAGSALSNAGPQAITAFKAIPQLGLGAKQIPAGVAKASEHFLKGSALGGVLGFGEGEGLQDSAEKAVTYAPALGVVGAALPKAIEYGVKPVARALQMPRLIDPEKIATSQINKAVRDSGLSVEEITKRVSDAHAAGQTEYTLADAIGKEGQRKLGILAKIPGEARDRITEFMTNRDLNMPTRVVGEVNRALGVQGTARQATDQLIDHANRTAGPLYRQAEHSGPVWNNAIDEILQTPAGRQGIARGVRIQQLETAGSGRPFNPTDAAITGFNEAGDPVISGVPNTKTLHTLKVGLDNMIEQNTDAVTGRVNAEGRALTIMKNRLLENMDALNPYYAMARALYRGPMEVKDAVRTGQDMATRGRYADNLDTFRAMTDAEKQGARIGYADKAVQPLERSGNFPAQLREKALKGSNELNELSLYQGPRQPGQPDQLRQCLNREESMIKGSHAALGGSSTAENIADAAAGPGGAQVFGLASSVASGNPMHAATSIMDFIKTAAKGESAAQRAAIARTLMERNPDAVQAIADRLEAFDQRRRGVNPWTGQQRIRP